MKEKPNTREKILEAAEQEFIENGFGGARTTVIAERAGVTHAMLHYYFRTKEQLFEQIVNKNVAVLEQTIIATMGEPDRPFVERLKSGISAHFDLIAVNPQLPRFFVNEVLLHPEQYKILYDKMKAKVQGLLASLQEEADKEASAGKMDKVDVRMLFVSFLSLNFFPFVAQSLWSGLLGDLMDDEAAYLEARKAENIKMMEKRLKAI